MGYNQVVFHALNSDGFSLLKKHVEALFDHLRNTEGMK